MTMDINEIKAGEYQLVAERWDERTSKPGEPFTFRRHRRGDIVKLDEADARRLVTAGAVVKPGELERRAAEQARRQYLALLAQMPADLRRELRAQDAAEAVIDLEDGSVRLTSNDDDEDVDEDGDASPERPPLTANKDVWIDFRVAESEGRLTKEQLSADNFITKAQLQDDAHVAGLPAAQS